MFGKFVVRAWSWYGGSILNWFIETKLILVPLGMPILRINSFEKYLNKENPESAGLKMCSQHTDAFPLIAQLASF